MDGKLGEDLMDEEKKVICCSLVLFYKNKYIWDRHSKRLHNGQVGRHGKQVTY